MIKTIVEDEQGGIYEVPSSSSNQKYICAISENGELFCSCPDFTFRKGYLHPHVGDVNKYCKHLAKICEEV